MSVYGIGENNGKVPVMTFEDGNKINSYVVPIVNNVSLNPTIQEADLVVQSADTVTKDNTYNSVTGVCNTLPDGNTPTVILKNKNDGSTVTFKGNYYVQNSYEFMMSYNQTFLAWLQRTSATTDYYLQFGTDVYLEYDLKKVYTFEFYASIYSPYSTKMLYSSDGVTWNTFDFQGVAGGIYNLTARYVRFEVNTSGGSVAEIYCFDIRKINVPIGNSRNEFIIDEFGANRKISLVIPADLNIQDVVENTLNGYVIEDLLMPGKYYDFYFDGTNIVKRGEQLDYTKMITGTIKGNASVTFDEVPKLVIMRLGSSQYFKLTVTNSDKTYKPIGADSSANVYYVAYF